MQFRSIGVYVSSLQDKRDDEAVFVHRMLSFQIVWLLIEQWAAGTEGLARDVWFVRMEWGLTPFRTNERGVMNASPRE